MAHQAVHVIAIVFTCHDCQSGRLNEFFWSRRQIGRHECRTLLQNSEYRSQKSEYRNQNTEIRIEKSEVRIAFWVVSSAKAIIWLLVPSVPSEAEDSVTPAF